MLGPSRDGWRTVTVWRRRCEMIDNGRQMMYLHFVDMDQPMAKIDVEPARAKLFTHGGSQAVRLPKAFRFDGAEVTVRREGDAVILEPAPPKPPRTRAELEAMFERIRALGGADFPDREQPPQQERDFDW